MAEKLICRLYRNDGEGKFNVNIRKMLKTSLERMLKSKESREVRTVL